MKNKLIIAVCFLAVSGFLILVPDHDIDASISPKLNSINYLDQIPQTQKTKIMSPEMPSVAIKNRIKIKQSEKQIYYPKQIPSHIENAREELISTDELLLYQHKIKIRVTKKDLMCMARNIYFEAATESDAGKYAVAQVTLNRVADSRFGNSVCDVVYFKITKEGSRGQYDTCAFTWVCEEPREPVGANWKRSIEIAEDVLYHGIGLETVRNALFYHATYINLPYWADPSKEIVEIGLHVFYSDAKVANKRSVQLSSN